MYTMYRLCTTINLEKRYVHYVQAMYNVKSRKRLCTLCTGYVQLYISKKAMYTIYRLCTTVNLEKGYVQAMYTMNRLCTTINLEKCYVQAMYNCKSQKKAIYRLCTGYVQC